MAARKKITLDRYELPVEIQEDEFGGYFAYCTSWEDCYAQGETVDEALNEITQVAQGLIELYKEEGLEVPLTHLPRRRKKYSFRVPLEA